RGATVRARRQALAPQIAPAASPANAVAVAPSPDALLQSARAAVVAGLSAPRLMTTLQMRVVTYSLQGPERGKVQLLIHGEIGDGYTSTARMSVGYVIS